MTMQAYGQKQPIFFYAIRCMEPYGYHYIPGCTNLCNLWCDA